MGMQRGGEPGGGDAKAVLHPSKSPVSLPSLSTMIFILLCQTLWLSTRTDALEPLSALSASASQFSKKHLLSGTLVASEPSQKSSATQQRQKRRSPEGEEARRPTRQLSSDDWNWFVTTGSSRPGFNSGSGLAYRSILPIAPTLGNHYSDLYRNRNLFNNNNNNHNDNKRNEDYYNGYAGQRPEASSRPKNSLDSSKSGRDGGRKRNPSLKPVTTATSITTEQRLQSAPATEVGKVSSTLEMSSGRDDAAAASKTSNEPSFAQKDDEESIVVDMQSQNDESSIVFPGSVSRSSRPQMRMAAGKRGASSRDNYVPPEFKNLDKAAWLSLKMLWGTRNRARSAGPSVRTSRTNSRAQEKRLDFLKISSRPACARDGYCEQVEGYPKEYFNGILENSLSADIFQNIFGDDPEVADIAGRTSFGEGSPLCTTMEQTIYPQTAENSKGEFMYIVNHDRYTQGVRVEKCRNEGGSCQYLEGTLTGYETTCRQKYIYKRLMAFDTSGTPITDNFKLPACCVCYVKGTFVKDRISSQGSWGWGVEENAPEGVDPVELVPKDTIRVSNSSMGMESLETSATEMLHDDILEVPTTSEPLLLEAQTTVVSSDKVTNSSSQNFTITAIPMGT